LYFKHFRLANVEDINNYEHVESSSKSETKMDLQQTDRNSKDVHLKKDI